MIELKLEYIIEIRKGYNKYKCTMKELIIAGIVTYNPSMTRLIENINSIKSQVYQVVIVDNNSSNIVEIRKIIKDNLIIIENNCNFGIAKALNQMMSYAKNQKVEWVLTLDQDSICPPNIVGELSKKIDKDIAIICPQIFDINKKNITTDSTRKNGNFVEECITSGALTSVDAWENIGKYDEKMFIDGVDFDFCHRLRKNGYYIYRADNIQLIHEIGNISMKKFLLFDVCVKNHSANRKYYIARNIIYMSKKYKNIKYKIKAVFQEIKLIVVVLLYEDDKINKVKRIILGIKDGIKLTIDERY